MLGVFDDGSAPVADAVMRSAKAALADVATAVPYDWSRTVVVYAPDRPAFLSGLGDVPGGDPLALDAVSFPVRSGDGRLAGTRIALHPRTLGSGPEVSTILGTGCCATRWCTSPSASTTTGRRCG